MADILLKRGSTHAATYVPNTFIDEYMTRADGEFVKVYLYLLRCMNSPGMACSICDIADKFDYTEKDVTRALKYWEKMQLLHLEFNDRRELTGICLSDFTDAGGAEVHADVSGTDSATDSASPSKPRKIPERMEYTPGQLLQFSEDETVKELLFVSERYLGHPLNTSEIQTILYWLDKLDFSQDLIEYLIEQCVAKNHASIRYMDKIAMAWAENGIHTLAKAKQDSAVHSHAVHAVCKAFGISNRSLGDAELKYVEKWSHQMEFSDELIALACQKTILSIHQISFGYADTILESWKRQNARTLNDIRLLDAQYQEARARKSAPAEKSKAASARTARGTLANGFSNFGQRTYNYDELERELLSHAR